MKRIFFILLNVSILLFVIQVHANENFIFGKAKIIDGDTIIIKGEKIRLFGIDAPEMKQICYNELDKPYLCGHESKKYLEKRIKREIYCYYSGRDRYKRIIGDCYTKSKISVNGFMVSMGYAVAYKKYSKKYIKHEKDAKINKRGIWRGKFTIPEQWRRKNK